MATYNWAYRPNVQNKYGIAIPQSDDDVRPSNVCYVAIFGNDITGNGSRKYPYKTISRGASIGSNVIIGSGVYREEVIGADGPSLYGDGNVILEGAGLYTGVHNSGGNSAYIYNITIQNYIIRSVNDPFFLYDCKIINCAINGFQGGQGNLFIYLQVVIIQIMQVLRMSLEVVNTLIRKTHL